jgi:V8-like Glu-specific endopeptidase
MHRDMLRRLYQGSCGICYADPDVVQKMGSEGTSFRWAFQKDSGIHFVGSGLAIHPHLVLTAGHVVQGLIYDAGIPRDHIFCVFSAFPADVQGYVRGTLPLSFHRVHADYQVGGNLLSGETISHDSSHPRTDFAILELKLPAPAFQALAFARSLDVCVGDSVAIAGYPHGNDAIFQDIFAHPRIGPLLTFGHVASVHQATTEMGQCEIADFLIDATAARGASGGPVCSETGEILGIVTGGLEQPVAGGQVPLNIVRALPLDRDLIPQFIKAIEPHLGT